MLIHEYRNKVEYVAAQLRKKIADGELTEQQRLGTSGELGREFGVSMMTADRAVRQLVEEGALVRVKGQGTYVPVKKRKLNVALLDGGRWIIPRGNGILYEENTYPIIQRECAARGMVLQPVQSVDSLLCRQADCLLTSTRLSSTHLPGMPIAYFKDYRMIDSPFIQVVPKLTPVMNEIFSRIGECASRKYYVTMTSVPNIRFFGERFLYFAKSYGIGNQDISVEVKVTKEGITAEEIGYDFGKRLANPKGAFIFSTSDFRSVGILKAFDERGIEPEDYDLISCNNWESYGFSPFSEPRLTSIDFRRETIFIHLIELLYQAAINKGQHDIIIRKVPSILKIRKTAFASPSHG